MAQDFTKTKMDQGFVVFKKMLPSAKMAFKDCRLIDVIRDISRHVPFLCMYESALLKPIETKSVFIYIYIYIYIFSTCL